MPQLRLHNQSPSLAALSLAPPPVPLKRKPRTAAGIQTRSCAASLSEELSRGFVCSLPSRRCCRSVPICLLSNQDTCSLFYLWFCRAVSSALRHSIFVLTRTSSCLSEPTAWGLEISDWGCKKKRRERNLPQQCRNQTSGHLAELCGSEGETCTWYNLCCERRVDVCKWIIYLWKGTACGRAGGGWGWAQCDPRGGIGLRFG